MKSSTEGDEVTVSDRLNLGGRVHMTETIVRGVTVLPYVQNIVSTPSPGVGSGASGRDCEPVAVRAGKEAQRSWDSRVP